MSLLLALFWRERVIITNFISASSLITTATSSIRTLYYHLFLCSQLCYLLHQAAPPIVECSPSTKEIPAVQKALGLLTFPLSVSHIVTRDPPNLFPLPSCFAFCYRMVRPSRCSLLFFTGLVLPSNPGKCCIRKGSIMNSIILTVPTPNIKSPFWSCSLCPWSLALGSERLIRFHYWCIFQGYWGF